MNPVCAVSVAMLAVVAVVAILYKAFMYLVNYAALRWTCESYDAAAIETDTGHTFINVPTNASLATAAAANYGAAHHNTPAQPGGAHSPAGLMKQSTLFYRHTTSRRVVLYSHGNGETLKSCASFLLGIHTDLQCSVFAYDYPGYGASSGSPCEASVIAAARGAYAHVTGPLGFAPSDVVLLAWSVGSGPSVDLAATVARDAAALVLMSPFRSCTSIVTGRTIGRFDMFNNEAKMANVRCPLLVIHGTFDRVVPFAHGPALVATAKSHRRGAGHAVVEFVEAKDYGHNVMGWSLLCGTIAKFWKAHVFDEEDADTTRLVGADNDRNEDKAALLASST